MSDERKLATIKIVTNVEPIPEADKIEKITIDGWVCVTKKDEVHVGDKVIYLEIDSIVPNIPFFEFMVQRKFRIKTIRLKKCISQGLILPTSSISEIVTQLSSNPEYKFKTYPIVLTDGDDLTELLGITKWLSPSERDAERTEILRKRHNWFTRFMTRFSWYRKLTKTKSKSFPNWISKTDEERIQGLSYENKFYPANLDKSYYYSEKIDGQSGTFWYKKHWFKPEFGICSRTVRKFELDMSNWSKVARKLDLKKKLKSIGKNIAIQGEVVGPSIQGNKYHLTDLDLYVFNVFDIDKKKYYTLDEMIEFCKKVDLKHVPILDSNFKLLPTVDEMVALSHGQSVLYPTLREGIVVRSHDMSISFKVVDPLFLLKNEE